MFQAAVLRTSAAEAVYPWEQQCLFWLAHMIEMERGWVTRHTLLVPWALLRGIKLSVLWSFSQIAPGLWNTPTVYPHSAQGWERNLAQGSPTFSRISKQQIWVLVLPHPCFTVGQRKKMWTMQINSNCGAGGKGCLHIWFLSQSWSARNRKQCLYGRK